MWGGVRKAATALCFSESFLGSLETEKRIRKLNVWVPLHLGQFWAILFSIMATALTVYQVFHSSSNPMRGYYTHLRNEKTEALRHKVIYLNPQVRI